MSDFRPCRECRDWKRCLLTETEREWFGPRHCWRFCPLHVFFLFRYESTLRGHRWPVLDTNTGDMITRTISEAAFTKSSDLLAELYSRINGWELKGRRISGTGWKGKLLISQCKNPDIMKIQWLDPDAKDALFYVSGDKRRTTPFAVWLAKRRYKKYTTTGITQS